MPLVMGSPWVGGYFGSAEVGITATGNLANQFVAEATIIVRKDGAGDFTTISAALAKPPVANDIIEVQATVAGGSQRFDETISPSSNGTSGNEITLRARASDTIRISATSNNDTLSFLNVHFWIVKDFANIGDADLTWLQSDGGRSVTARRNIVFGSGTSHIDLIDNGIWGGRATSGTFSHGNFLSESTSVIRIKGGFIRLCGSNNDPEQSPPAERGDLFFSQTTNIIVEDVDFSEGGHNAVEFYGPNSILRNCNCSGDWTARSTGKPGARIGQIQTDRDDRGSAPWGPNLIEGNIFRDAGESGDTVAQTAHKLDGNGCIVRGNYYFDNVGAIWNVVPANVTIQPFALQKNRCYHNTGINNGIMLRVRDTAAQKDMHFNHEYKNNIFVEFTGVSREDADVHVYNDKNSINQQGTPDDWIGDVFAGNRLHATGKPIDIFLRFDTHKDVAGAETQWPLVWTGGNIEGDASFVNEGARTKAGLALTGISPDIGAAEPLTNVASNSSGATLTLESVEYFYDGFDLAYFGEDQKVDYIKVVPTGLDPDENGTIVRITYQGRNDSLSQVTIDQSLVVTAGDDVYWSDGTIVFSNRGAGQ